jgi:hypothetical protein
MLSYKKGLCLGVGLAFIRPSQRGVDLNRNEEMKRRKHKQKKLRTKQERNKAKKYERRLKLIEQRKAERELAALEREAEKLQNKALGVTIRNDKPSENEEE